MVGKAILLHVFMTPDWNWIEKIVRAANFEAIEACTDYEINGEKTKQLPFDLCTTEIKPVYHKLCGWKTDLRAFTSYDDLPETFLGYLNFLEEYFWTSGLPATGPGCHRPTANRYFHRAEAP